jgi:hypothetical protein
MAQRVLYNNNGRADSVTLQASSVDLGNVTNDAQVKGIASSTDNAIVRWDSTTGKLVQDSLITISDNGSVYPNSNGGITLGTTSNYWGHCYFGHMNTAGYIELSIGLSGNRYSLIDFHGDDTYFDYGLRVIRENSGANAPSKLEHRGTGNLYIYGLESSSFLLVLSGTEKILVNSSGNVYLKGLNTTSSTSGYGYLMQNTSNLEIRRYTSSERYKKNITDIEIDTSKIYQLRPVSFEDNGEADKDEYGYDKLPIRKEIGLIAEEVDEILPELVYYDKDRLPEGVHYNNLSVILLSEIKKIKNKLEELEVKVYGNKKEN